MEDLEELKNKANPFNKVNGSVKNNGVLLARLLDIIEGDAEGTNKNVIEALENIDATLKCIKREQKAHWGYGRKVTAFTLCLAVVALSVEVASKGELPLFSIAWQYIKGLLV